MKCAESLKALGVNVEEGLDRVMGDEEMYEMMLGMFIDMINDANIKLEDFDSSNLDDLIKNVHTLKGTTGNLSLTPLFEGYMETLGLLRDNKPKEAKAVYEKMLPVQSDILDCIRQ